MLAFAAENLLTWADLPRPDSGAASPGLDGDGPMTNEAFPRRWQVAVTCSNPPLAEPSAKSTTAYVDPTSPVRHRVSLEQACSCSLI